MDQVWVAAWERPDSGLPSTGLGYATYGDARSDVAATYGARYTNAGYHLAVSTLTPDSYELSVWTHNTSDSSWTMRTATAYVNIPIDALTITRGGTGTGGIGGTNLTCPGGSLTQAVPCGATLPVLAVETLTAVPDPGSTFTGWGGACAGTNPSCTITMQGALQVVATFTKTPAERAAFGSGSENGRSVDCETR